MKPFIVPEMNLKVIKSLSICHPSLDQLEFLSETGKVGYTSLSFRQTELK